MVHKLMSFAIKGVAAVNLRCGKSSIFNPNVQVSDTTEA